MRESEKIYEDIFQQELEPTLLKLDFTRYFLPEGWIQPTFLYKHRTKNIWFGCSWDWRDFYFEAELGSLVKIKDVLPRVIVIGFLFEKKCHSKNTSEYITEQVLNGKKEISDFAVNYFEKYYKFIREAQREKLHRLKKFIEKEILSDKELPFINKSS